MATPTLMDAAQTIKFALSKIGDIATLPEVTAKIISVVDDPKSTARDLHNIIKNDPALSTKILKVVNSAFYGLPGQVSEVDRAIVLLGHSAVKNIAISASISRLFSNDRICDGFNARDISKHCLAVAVATRQLCANIGRRAFAEEAFLAGLIHDLGLLVERQAFPEQLKEIIRIVSETNRPFTEVELELIGVDHQMLGAALAAKWKFPRTLQIVIGYHHRIANLTEENRMPTAIVYIADALACEEQIGFHICGNDHVLDDALLESIGHTRADFEAVRQELMKQVEDAETIFRF